jgi:hypothetical protein
MLTAVSTWGTRLCAGGDDGSSLATDPTLAESMKYSKAGDIVLYNDMGIVQKRNDTASSLMDVGTEQQAPVESNTNVPESRCLPQRPQDQT